MAVVGALLIVAGCDDTTRYRSVPPDAPFDYQVGGDYPPPPGVEVLSRDWFAGAPLEGGYSICYVNAFQTQPDDEDVDRPDERSAWPQDVILTGLGEDPNWGGEYLVDLSTPASRTVAARWVEPMIDTCAEKGFDAVELDNLDSWTRFDDTPLAGEVPFGPDQAVAFATTLTDHAHDRGLAVAQKNALELAPARGDIGFDFVVVEECGATSGPDYDECAAYADTYDDAMVASSTPTTASPPPAGPSAHPSRWCDGIWRSPPPTHRSTATTSAEHTGPSRMRVIISIDTGRRVPATCPPRRQPA